jgi:hypothetical protein
MALASTGHFSKALNDSNRLLLVANVLLLIAALVIAGMNASTFIQQVNGPKAIDAAAFDNLGVSLQSFKTRHVTLTGTNIIDTGASEITVRKKRGIERGRSETAHYYALAVNGKFLLVRGTNDAHGTPTVSGWISEPKKVDASTLAQINAGPAQGKMFTNIVLDETDDGTFTWIVALVVLAAILLSAWNIYKALGRGRDAAKFPAIASQPEAVRKNTNAFVAAVDRDLASSTKGLGALRIGNTFALRQKSMRVDLLAFDQLAWIYPQIVKKKMFYVIPAGADHSIKAFSASGQAYDWPTGSNAEKSTALFETLVSRAPAAIAGYSADIEALWKKNRNEFLAIIAERKAKLAADAAAVTTQVTQPSGT